MRTRLLVCDDESTLREMLRILFTRAGYDVETATGVRTCKELLASSAPFDVVITDLSMPDGSGMDVLEASRERDDSTQVVLITAYASASQAVDAMRKGAYDYVEKPFRNEEIKATVEKALEKRQILSENKRLRAVVNGVYADPSIVGKSRALARVMKLVERAAPSPTNVLVTGESGTGKEMIARALHRLSGRSGAFVPVNCGALPENLMESELFGHVKGAFTGAIQNKEGLFSAADKGTLFLDEIGELPSALQVKLLRVLQEHRFRPVGAQKEVQVDVRVVAATNRDLERAIDDSSFRQDLYYRLNVITLELPPLRERPEDIPLLAQHFLDKHSDNQKKQLRFSADALRWICNQPYRGNVRELENVIERAVTMALGDNVTLDDLPGATVVKSVAPTPQIEFPARGMNLENYLAEVEKDLLIKALDEAEGVRTRAAKLLGMTFRSFRYRLAKYDLGEKD